MLKLVIKKFVMEDSGRKNESNDDQTRREKFVSENRKSQRDSEAAVFAEFCQAAELDFSLFEHKDAPDFISTDGTLGIELTGYHEGTSQTGSNVRRREAEFERMLEISERIYKSFECAVTNVFLFPAPIPPPRKVVDQLASKIATIVRNHAGQTIELSWGDLPREILPYVAGLTIYPSSGDSRWQVAEAANLDTSVDAIAAIIDSKEKKVDAYRSRVTDIRLLIYSSCWPCLGSDNGGRPSTTGRITKELASHPFQSSFDKVYFFDRSDGIYWELYLLGDV